MQQQDEQVNKKTNWMNKPLVRWKVWGVRCCVGLWRLGIAHLSWESPPWRRKRKVGK